MISTAPVGTRPASALDKPVERPDAAVRAVKPGDTVFIGGFGGAGFPFALREALSKARPERLTLVCNNADFGELAAAGALARIICSYPTGASAGPVLAGIEDGSIELQLTPQGTLVERIRAGGAGLGGVLTPTGIDTELASQWEEHVLDGRRFLIVPALRGDVALVRASVADTLGNLYFRGAARNFNPSMAMAASHTIAEVERVVPAGEIDPRDVHVPGVFVDTLVEIGEERGRARV